VTLIGAGVALAYADRHLVPASLTGWTVSDVSMQVVNAAVPMAAFVLASRRPENRLNAPTAPSDDHLPRHADTQQQPAALATPTLARQNHRAGPRP
jgi:hypothetical protein